MCISAKTKIAILLIFSFFINSPLSCRMRILVRCPCSCIPPYCTIFGRVVKFNIVSKVAGWSSGWMHISQGHSQKINYIKVNYEHAWLVSYQINASMSCRISTSRLGSSQMHGKVWNALQIRSMLDCRCQRACNLEAFWNFISWDWIWWWIWQKKSGS